MDQIKKQPLIGPINLTRTVVTLTRTGNEKLKNIRVTEVTWLYVRCMIYDQIKLINKLDRLDKWRTVINFAARVLTQKLV